MIVYVIWIVHNCLCTWIVCVYGLFMIVYVIWIVYNCLCIWIVYVIWIVYDCLCNMDCL